MDRSQFVLWIRGKQHLTVNLSGFPKLVAAGESGRRSTDLPSQIHSELTGLDVTKQRQVLAFVHTLKQAPRGGLGRELKGFAGTLSEDDARSMIEAIQAGCELVAADGW